ncbi:hypothetical protein K504DRAFT_385581 [Pleomassaria siparia CBS 279.74]|uniref:DNA replication checkpoint mediator MRC1 domain-containing protein n=1 Tax=Pleomassaria siparia CBS 279.74 TaxID=1314801 RepID=A0A6G1K364_9PLEO|nr:hypothetical protein K504DRAFT_385581 [Pleomassaria siparia CBS 279.74]
MESDSESDDAAPVQPRRKLLAALKPNDSEDSSESEEDDNGEGAYERIRAQLMYGTSQRDAQNTPQAARKAPTLNSSEDEVEVTVRTHNRRLVARVESSIPSRLSPSTSVRSRRSSPGLFVTPNASPVKKIIARPSPSAESDSDNATDVAHNADLEERVRRIRAERKARDQEKRAKKASRRASQDSDSDPDGENGRRLTQQARPTRKASKKALEDMSREQQRISRNMQLTHQAKTKKRYTTKDLLATFGFNQTEEEPTTLAQLPTPDASSMLASSDAEVNQSRNTTPPMSPSGHKAMASKDQPLERIGTLQDMQITSPPRANTEKGKGRAPEYQHLPANPLAEKMPSITVQRAQVELKEPVTTDMVDLSDSDDGLEIERPKTRFPVFDRLPQHKNQEAPSLLHLRHLAHLTSNENTRRPKSKNVMSVTELQNSLALKARQQATKEREEKLEDMRRRGIHIETEEEREKQQMEIEDMVAQFEKARQEDLELSKMERGEAKQNGEAGDELMSSDDDEDYVGSGDEIAGEVEDAEEPEEDVELELSGSEEEDLDDEADDEEELEETDALNKSNGLIDEMANEENEDEHIGDSETIEDEVASAPSRKRTVNRSRNVIIDDEDESENEAPKASASAQEATQTLSGTQDSIMAAFGFNNAGPTLGLTQMFAGTMANMESDSQSHLLDGQPEQDSFELFRSLPDTQPGFSQASDTLVPNSQALESRQEFPHDGPLSQVRFGVSQLVEPFPTQISEVPEPTQDVGFNLSRSPAGLVRPPSTIDTVIMAVAESPIMKRKGKLQQRKNIAAANDSDVEIESVASESDVGEETGTEKAGDAFAVMKKATKKKQAIDSFNKKTSWAKDAVEEQAEESEDEYAGIGGADGEDSDEDDEELAKMIDTEDVKVDERKMAAFFAEKSKIEDEKAINQLYKDVMHGGLRKKQAAGAFDMSDSEDEAEQRRRKKQMQFKQMTKALIADDRIGQIAQNPKKSAFFNTLADHMDDPDYDFLNAPEMEVEMDTSQSQPQSQSAEINDSTEILIPDSQADTTASPTNPLKRKSLDSQDKENRPPPNLRRTAATDTNIARKPISFADVQTSVMELLDDPRIMVPDSQFSESESESEAAVKPTSRKPIIDRLTLSRTASMESELGAGGHLAFHAPSASTGPGFRVPSLLRRGTSNLSVVSTGSGTNTPTEGAVRRGGTGRSNIHAQAREAERRAVLEKADQKRKDTLKKKVNKAKGKRSILKDLDGGFE